MLNNEEMMQMFHYDGRTECHTLHRLGWRCNTGSRDGRDDSGMSSPKDCCRTLRNGDTSGLERAEYRLARHPNVMIDPEVSPGFSMMNFILSKEPWKPFGKPRSLVGMEKLMWGSDYPRTITAITYKMSYDFVVKSSELTEEDKRLFGRECRKLLWIHRSPRTSLHREYVRMIEKTPYRKTRFIPWKRIHIQYL